jgi:hypothetical protein
MSSRAESHLVAAVVVAGLLTAVDRPALATQAGPTTTVEIVDQSVEIPGESAVAIEPLAADDPGSGWTSRTWSNRTTSAETAASVMPPATRGEASATAAE